MLGLGLGLHPRVPGLNVALPYTVIDKFDVDTGYTKVGTNATKALDNGSMLLTGGNLNETMGLDRTYTGPFDPATLGCIAVLVERVSGAASNIALSVSLNGVALANVNFVNEAGFSIGEHWCIANISEWPLSAATSPGTLRVRILISQSTGVQYRIKRLVVGQPAPKAQVILTYDDGYATIINTALPAHQERGFPGTHYVAPSLLGAGGKMVEADLTTLRNAGWALCCDGTTNDVAMTTGDGAAAVAQTNVVRDWLVARGLTGGENHLCYPFGTHDQAMATALRAAGYLSARTVEPQSVSWAFGIGNGVNLALPSQPYTTASFAAAWPGRLSEIISRKTAQIFHFHADIADNSAAVYLAFLDALKDHVDAGDLDVVTMPQFIASQGTTPN